MWNDLDAPPDVPSTTAQRPYRAGHFPRPLPPFIALGDGAYAKRDAIVGTVARKEDGGSTVMLSNGHLVSGSRPHSEFLKDLLGEGA